VKFCKHCDCETNESIINFDELFPLFLILNDWYGTILEINIILTLVNVKNKLVFYELGLHFGSVK